MASIILFNFDVSLDLMMGHGWDSSLRNKLNMDFAKVLMVLFLYINLVVL